MLKLGLRFRIANFIMGDELRTELRSIKHNCEQTLEISRRFESANMQWISKMQRNSIDKINYLWEEV